MPPHFLDALANFITGLAIPVSVIGTFALMYSTASLKVRSFSVSSSGMSMSNSFSKAITSSTVSSESAPRARSFTVSP